MVKSAGSVESEGLGAVLENLLRQVKQSVRLTLGRIPWDLRVYLLPY